MKATPRLPLNALRVFEAVARLKSMTRAAEALNVQPSAVSMQMKNLADFIGLPLVARSGRRIELTRHGEALLPAVLEGLAQIEERVRSLRRAAKEQPFTLSVIPAFLHLWLDRRLPAFAAAHPSFKLRIHTSRELVDVARGEADAAVRLGPGRWPGVDARKLMDEGLVPVCAPQLAKRVGRLRRGEIPKGVPLLQSSRSPWSEWSPEGHHGERPSIVADDAISAIRAAVQGKGIAIAHTTFAEAALQEGTLVALAEPIPYRWSYYWVTAKGAPQDPRAKVLFEWLRGEARRRGRW